MPLNAMNLGDGGRETRRNVQKANSLRNGLLPGTGLVHEAVFYNGWKAGGTRTREGTPAAMPNASKPQRYINGYINHWYRGKGAKTVPPSSPAPHIPTAGKVGCGGTSDSVLVNESTSRDINNLPSPNQTVPETGQSAADSASTAAKKQKMKKFRHKRRGAKNPKPPSLPPEESEDWEKDIQDVVLTDWEGQIFGFQPYGPEDLLPFALRDLSIQEGKTFDRPLTANYRPSVRHPHPMTWKSFTLPTEPGQFTDADE